MKPTDCRSEEGITEGLIDSIIFICRILAKRDLGHSQVQNALKDLKNDKDARWVIDRIHPPKPEFPKNQVMDKNYFRNIRKAVK